MTESPLSADLVAALREQSVEKDPLEATDRLGDLGLDSLDALELAMSLEQRTGRAINDDEVQAWITLGDVQATVGTGPRN